MTSPLRRLRTAVERWWWPRSVGPRRVGRAIRRELSVLRSRIGREPARVVWLPPRGSSDPHRDLDPQPEIDWIVDGDPALLPPEIDEALRLVAMACDVDIAVAGTARPAEGLHATGPVHRFHSRPGSSSEGASAVAMALRHGREDTRRDSPVAARLVPWIDEPPQPDVVTVPLTVPLTRSAGPDATGLDLLRLDAAVPGRAHRRRVVAVDEALSALPASPDPDGRPTLLFLLPYLAVGGAERLLYDLLDGLRDRYRLLVATTDPHRRVLGQTIERCRDLADRVYLLGDWLPRPALASALRHLIRRHAVDALVSWNGTVLFYDEVVALKRRFPRLRILAQLYHHDGSWTARTGGATARAIDTHLAVNRRIAEALVAERGVDPERVALVHHGVPVPSAVPEAERVERRIERRRALGLPALGVPDDALVFGAFLRLHPQKRPLDLIALARRLAHRLEADGWWLLLVGGGPLDDAIERELTERPAPNVVRLQMTRDPLPLYDAVDVCVSTSSYEGLPVFLLDALARGIPCVATAVGDVPLLLADGGGVLVERPGDLDAFTAALRSLADSERRRQEGERGRRTVAERFGLEAYRAAYERLLPSRAGAGVAR